MSKITQLKNDDLNDYIAERLDYNFTYTTDLKLDDIWFDLKSSYHLDSSVRKKDLKTLIETSFNNPCLKRKKTKNYHLCSVFEHMKFKQWDLSKEDVNEKPNRKLDTMFYRDQDYMLSGILKTIDAQSLMQIPSFEFHRPLFPYELLASKINESL